VFLIQNTQNRESLATQLKLDEILRSIKEARNDMIDLENMSDQELEKVAKEFKDLCPRNTGDGVARLKEARDEIKAEKETVDQNS
jgi:low affinity Fe/Cu permease